MCHFLHFYTKSLFIVLHHYSNKNNFNKMRKVFLMAISIAMFAAVNAQVKVDRYSNMGIGISPSTSYKLYVHGNVRISHWTDLILDMTGGSSSSPVLYPERDYYFQLGTSTKKTSTLYAYNVRYYNGLYKSSDKRIKRNIRAIDSSMNILNQLSGVQYELIPEAIGDSLPESVVVETIGKNNFGFIAQEVQKVIPEIVMEDDSTGLLSIDYTSLIPIMVEALKAQQELNKSLAKQLKKVKKRVKALENNSSPSQKSATFNSSEENAYEHLEAQLFQNNPNPFNIQTNIKCVVPESVNESTLHIYNMNGSPINTYPIIERGEVNIEISSSELNTGMYLYTLIADGQEIDTKRMILTE